MGSPVQRDGRILGVLDEGAGGEQHPRLLLGRDMGAGGNGLGQHLPQAHAFRPHHARLRGERDERRAVAELGAVVGS